MVYRVSLLYTSNPCFSPFPDCFPYRFLSVNFPVYVFVINFLRRRNFQCCSPAPRFKSSDVSSFLAQLFMRIWSDLVRLTAFAEKNRISFSCRNPVWYSLDVRRTFSVLCSFTSRIRVFYHHSVSIIVSCSNFDGRCLPRVLVFRFCSYEISVEPFAATLLNKSTTTQSEFPI